MLLYCRADTDGHANSAFAIGLMFAGGHGFKQDQPRAYAWFKRAAALGHPEASDMVKLFRQRGKRGAVNATENINGDMRDLRWLLRHFKGDATKTVAAYNAGEGAVRKYDGIPPYRETQNYVRKIRRPYTKLCHPI